MERVDTRTERLLALGEKVVGACVEVHRQLGPGLPDAISEECLCHELKLRGLGFQRRVEVPVVYKGRPIDGAYRLDVIVEKQLLVELESATELHLYDAKLVT